jgi:predicted aspartyl protease
MRIPRASLLMSVFVGLTLPALAHANRIHRQPSPAELGSKAESVRFDLYKGYFTVLHGSAGPAKNLNIFLDTGTSPPLLDSRIAKKLHLHGTEPARIAVLGGRVPGEYAILPSLRIGPMQRSNLQVVVADLSFFQKFVPFHIDAIVGLDVLDQKPFVIDYSARTIRFGATPVLPVSVPLRLDRGLAVFNAEIGHTPVRLLLDTGASSLVLFTKATAQTSGVKVDALLGQEDIGKFENKPVWLRMLKLGSVEFFKEPALLTLNPRPSQFDYDGVISPPVLGFSRVAVNVEAGTLAFSR